MTKKSEKKPLKSSKKNLSATTSSKSSKGKTPLAQPKISKTSVRSYGRSRKEKELLAPPLKPAAPKVGKKLDPELDKEIDLEIDPPINLKTDKELVEEIKKMKTEELSGGPFVLQSKGNKGHKAGDNDSSIQWYLEEINKIPLLTREQEDELARRAIDGDELAKNKLILANLRFVVQIAKRYRKYGITLLDLINEGNMGLIRAAEKFDPNLGYHFISYAVWWIRQAIMLAIHQKASMIRLPMNRTIDLNRIEKIQKDLGHELGEEPTMTQIAERLSIPEEEVRWLKQLSTDYVSLDQPVYDDSENSQMSMVEDVTFMPEKMVMGGALHEAINSILKELTEQERLIIELRFGLNGKKRLSLTRASETLRLSKERVRQIEKKTLGKLQKYARRLRLDEFLN